MVPTILLKELAVDSDGSARKVSLRVGFRGGGQDRSANEGNKNQVLAGRRGGGEVGLSGRVRRVAVVFIAPGSRVAAAGLGPMTRVITHPAADRGNR
jgi:hypothetical protein